MGYDVTCIVGTVDEELLCPICADVLEDPVQSFNCEHTYCRSCINTWMDQKLTCPVDRLKLEAHNLVPVSRLMRNMLARLQIKCKFNEDGCTQVLSLDEYRSHVATCEHNPRAVVQCTGGCGMMVPKNELEEHNCIHELRNLMQGQLSEINELKELQIQQDRRIEMQCRELALMQYYVSALRSTNPTIRAIGEQLDRYSLMQWAIKLPFAKVQTWGSLISTPDPPMLLMVCEQLRLSGCPMHLVDVLANRCHENNYPEGLTRLELRRQNTEQMTQFIMRLLPTHNNDCPFVVITNEDNKHMPSYLRPALGLVLIFLNGVEELQSENSTNRG